MFKIIYYRKTLKRILEVYRKDPTKEVKVGYLYKDLPKNISRRLFYLRDAGFIKLWDMPDNPNAYITLLPKAMDYFENRRDWLIHTILISAILPFMVTVLTNLFMGRIKELLHQIWHGIKLLLGY